MATPKKKTKPEKYTKAFVSSELANMLDEIKSNKDLVFVGELFEERNYSRQRFSEWVEKFVEDKQISDTIKRIKEIFESRVVTGAMRGKLNPTMTIFHLKNNYDWKDKHDLTHGGDNDNPVQVITRKIVGG